MFFFGMKKTFLYQKEVINELKDNYKQMTNGKELITFDVANSTVSLEEAISSYLFNTRLLRNPNNSQMTLIASEECLEVSSVKIFLDHF